MVQSTKLKLFVAIIMLMAICLSGCSIEKQEIGQKAVLQEWLLAAELSDHATSEELYQEALKEDTLVIYSVSSRTFEVKESFEKEYPGLTVEVKDIRGDDVVDMLHSNYEKGEYNCDLVICSDCDGRLYKELIEPGILYAYTPFDIKPNMKEGHADRETVFLGEALLLFYNSTVFDEQPIQNIWALTEEAYKGKIIMANPLSSFSTYGFCTAMFAEQEALKEAYEAYFGKPIHIPDGKSVGEIFWEMTAPNMVFTNSSDEVLEGIGNSGSDGMLIGIMISSKLRYQGLGYHFAPMYQLEPFAAVYTPNSVTIAGGARNVHSAKLFIRYLLGEKEGTGEGIQPFSTVGTWSTRTDVADGNPVPLSEIDYVSLDKEYLYTNQKYLNDFFASLLEENVN